MGGFAAKQRRRLERQSLQPPTVQTNVGKARTKASLTEHPRKQKIIITAPPKKTIRKPKHLKRKLDAIENGGICLSEEEQERLRRQMKEFELIKGHRKKLKVAEAQSDFGKSRSSHDDIPRETPTNILRQRQGSQEILPHKIEIKPFSEPKDCELKIVASNDKDDDDDHSVDEVDLNMNLSRQRGKRRRGRKDISLSSVSASAVEVSDGMDSAIVPTKSDKTDGGVVSNRESLSPFTKSPAEITSEEKNSSEVRRCIGRKPVTDYKVGQSYAGKVVYAKSFGVFFDIGCHSDAFCHVSQLSDQFIESPIESFPVGKLIENGIRVVAIDRRKKRLTVSLQPPSSDKNSERSQKKNELPSISRDEVLPDQDFRCRTEGNCGNMKSTDELVSAEQLKRARKIARRAQRRGECVQ